MEDPSDWSLEDERKEEVDAVFGGTSEVTGDYLPRPVGLDVHVESKQWAGDEEDEHRD